MKIKDLKKYLDTRSREQLMAEIGDMFSKIDSVRDYYRGKLNLGYSAEVAEKYKSIIKHEFFPARGFGRAQLSIARKAVSDYRKVSDSKFGVADVMLYYVEMGVQFTNTYGDIDEAFYNSMESMYERAVKYIVQHRMQGQFEEGCRKIVADTSEMGWGFHDGLSCIYEEHFKEESSPESKT
jgi:Family of unknown function (DUF6155)